jgi:hypothetical protein
VREIKFMACKGFEGRYEVGSDGSVYGLYWGRQPLKQFNDKDGYPHVLLQIHQKRYIRRVHKLVAEAFLPPKPTPKHQINHKNGIRHDNRAENLEWLTSQENTIDGWARGRKHTAAQRLAMSARSRGKLNPKAKLTHELIDQIRSLRASGAYLRTIAAQFGISTSQAGAICQGRFWR